MLFNFGLGIHLSILLMSKVWSKLARVGTIQTQTNYGYIPNWKPSTHPLVQKHLLTFLPSRLSPIFLTWGPNVWFGYIYSYWFVLFQKRPYCHTTNRHSHHLGVTVRPGQPRRKGLRVPVKEKGRGVNTSAPTQSRPKAATWGPIRSTLENYVSH